jgi:hypothetical protein
MGLPKKELGKTGHVSATVTGEKDVTLTKYIHENLLQI